MFTPCSSVSIVNYAHVIASWKGLRILKTCKPCHVWAGAPSYLLLLLLLFLLLLLLLTLFIVGKNSIGYLELLDKLQTDMQDCWSFTSASLEPLAHRRNVASSSLFYSITLVDVHLNWLN